MTMSIPDAEYRDFSRRIFHRSIVHAQPTRMQLEITYRCNIHCVHCYTDPFNTPAHLRQELAVRDLLRIFDELADAGVLWVTITGGEAFVHPHFRQIYTEARRRGFLVSLYSNGTTISESLADFLANDPPFTIDLSLHGATPETFERVTQVPGSFRPFRDGLGRLLERDLPVRIKTKAMGMNRHELAKIKALVEGLGLDFNVSATIHPRLDGDLSSTEHRLSPGAIVELDLDGTGALEDAADTCAGDRGERAAGPALEPPPDDRLFRCGCGTNTATISPYGMLRACTHTTWPAFDLKTMPFLEAFARLVEAIRSARYTGESPCRTCPVYTLCEKNPVMAEHEAGSMEAPVTHYCDVAFGKAATLAQRGLP